MQIYGEIKKVTPVQSGTSSEGKEWKNQMMVIETLDSHPKKVAFKVFGEDRIKKVAESRPFEKEGVKFWSTDLVFLSF